MNLPILSTKQAMTQLNKGRTVLVLNVEENTYQRISHATHDLNLITLKSIEKKCKTEYYLDCPKEYSDFIKKYSIKQLVHMMGMFFLILGMACFFVYSTYELSQTPRLSKDNFLFLSLSLSLIGCYHVVCFIDLITEQNDEYIELFLK